MQPSRPMRVFAADVFLTVTIEKAARDDADESSDEAEIHLHPGGQGIWIARMVRALGEDVHVHTALGGETGLVVEHLVRSSGIGIRPVHRSGDTQGYVHDRRGGTRLELVQGRRSLGRHELDDVFEDLLSAAADCELLYLTGRADHRSLPASFYERLGADLATLGARVVGDLHGPELAAFLESGTLEVLKVSDEDLATDGHATDENGLRDWASGVAETGVPRIVISRAAAPTMALWDGEWFEASSPPMSVADHRGAGDSMTAALGVSLVRGLGPVEALALGCGAGAASVTRHGLATVDARLISELASRVDVRRIDRP